MSSPWLVDVSYMYRYLNLQMYNLNVMGEICQIVCKIYFAEKTFIVHVHVGHDGLLNFVMQCNSLK